MNKEYLIGFAWCYKAVGDKKDQMEEICIGMDGLLNKYKGKRIYTHPVSNTKEEAWGFAFTSTPEVTEYDLDEWFAEEIKYDDGKGEYESRLESELEYRDRHGYYYDIDDEE